MKEYILKIKASVKPVSVDCVEELTQDLAAILEDAVRHEDLLSKELGLLEYRISELQKEHQNKIKTRLEVGTLVSKIESLLSGE